MSSGLTRKERIMIAERFVRSGFKGISCSFLETRAEPKNPKSSLGNLVASTVTEAELNSLSDNEKFRARPATREEMTDGDKLTHVMLVSGFTKEQAKIIYLRSFLDLPWKVIALKFNTDWAHARRMYDDALIIIYNKANL